MPRWILIVLLQWGLILPAVGQVGIGDTVRLVERDIHIPAHPAPGDPAVSFRFAGGSTANVIAIDATTGWINIRGEQVGGGDVTGWITKRYIAATTTPTDGDDTDVPDTLTLDWCPPLSSPDLHPSGRLRIASWNIENLHAIDEQSTFTGDDPSVKRIATDYERIRCYIRLFDPDILAVQEIDGEEALRRVVDTEVYDLLVSQRPLPSGMNGKQNTGFIYKKGLNVQPQADFTDLDLSNGRLRFGTRIDLTHNGTTIHLMSVHLKSGCFSNDNSGSSCNKLFDQVPVLESWIDEQAAGPNPFIVLGDFNRRFNLPDDIVWSNIDDADPENADLTAITEDMPISCRNNKFTHFIDHIVFGKRAITFADRSSFRHVTYRQDDKPVWSKISDHCPVVVELWIP